MFFQKTIRVVLVGIAGLIVCSSANAADPILFDFDDGHQGWNVIAPFGGNMLWMSGEGNPGGCIASEDTVAGGAPLRIQAPDSINGDLRWASSITWDEYVYSNYGDTTLATSWSLFGSDGTRWLSANPLGPLDTWRSRSVNLVEDEWTLMTGSMPFAEVIKDCVVAINTDCNVGTLPAMEARIDNVRFVPEPASLCLLLLGSAALLRRR